MTFLALDFETGGVDPRVHAPVSLGVAAMSGAEVLARMEWMIAPPTNKEGKITRAYDVVALEVSGTSWPKLKREGVPVSQVMAELAEFVRDCPYIAGPDIPVVAYNAPFDMAFYSECLFLAGEYNQHTRRFETFPPPVYGPWQCVRMLARIMLPGLDQYTLDAVAAACGLARSGQAHGALEDAILAGKIFAHLTNAAAVAA